MAKLPALRDLRSLVGDLRQVASVRRVVIADGPEAGVDVLAFTTGGGLDFWVVVSWMLDIAVLSWRGVQIGWQSAAGMRQIPEVPGDERRFERGFGGFLNTCGFDHIRQPAGGLPLHGSAPFAPALLTSYGENWDLPEPMLSCEGEAVVRAQGRGYRLRRRIEAPIGKATIRIRDNVEVISPQSSPILALYHFNLGYPAVCEGTEVHLGEEIVVGPLVPPEPAAMPATLHAISELRARCRVACAPAFDIAFDWRTDTLPWLQIWRDLRPGHGVLSIEPCCIGRLPDGRNEPSPLLESGEARSFEIDISVTDNQASD